MKIEDLKDLAERWQHRPAKTPTNAVAQILARAMLAGIAEAERMAKPERNADEYRAGKQTAAEAILASMEDAT